MPPPLSPQSRRRLVWISLAPGIVLIASVVKAAISLAYSDVALYGPPEYGSVISNLFVNPYGDLAPAVVRRCLAVTEALQALEPLALASLFAAGLRRWSRAEGSWTRVIAVALAGIAFAAGTFAVGAYAALDRADADGLDISTWMSLARSFGLMAVGYFFLAYRGTTSARRVIGRRQLPQV